MRRPWKNAKTSNMRMLAQRAYLGETAKQVKEGLEEIYDEKGIAPQSQFAWPSLGRIATASARQATPPICPSLNDRKPPSGHPRAKPCFMRLWTSWSGLSGRTEMALPAKPARKWLKLAGR